MYCLLELHTKSHGTDGYEPIAKKTHKCCQILGCPLRWNSIDHGKKAEPRNSGLCPSEGRNPFYPGIFFASAVQKNSRICLKFVFPVLLITLRSFSVLKGGTHSILAKRRNWENSEIPKFFDPGPGVPNSGKKKARIKKEI